MGQSDPGAILATLPSTLGYIGVSLLKLSGHNTSEPEPPETRSEQNHHINFLVLGQAP